MSKTHIAKIQEYRRDLLELQAWCERHPDYASPQWSYCFGGSLNFSTEYWDDEARATVKRTPAELANLVRAMKDLMGKVDKRSSDEYMTYEARTKNGKCSLTLSIAREQVCEARVVGQETVMVPDPDAPKVAKVRDKIEWKCAPILAGAEQELLTSGS